MPRTARREVETDSDQMLKELKTTKLVCSKLEFSKKKKGERRKRRQKRRRSEHSVVYFPLS